MNSQTVLHAVYNTKTTQKSIIFLNFKCFTTFVYLKLVGGGGVSERVAIVVPKHLNNVVLKVFSLFPLLDNH